MDRIDWIVNLLHNVKAEKRRLYAMKLELNKIEPTDPDYWAKRYKIESSYRPLPDADKINNDLKFIRRLLKDEYV